MSLIPEPADFELRESHAGESQLPRPRSLTNKAIPGNMTKFLAYIMAQQI